MHVGIIYVPPRRGGTNRRNDTAKPLVGIMGVGKTGVGELVLSRASDGHVTKDRLDDGCCTTSSYLVFCWSDGPRRQAMAFYMRIGLHRSLIIAPGVTIMRA